MKETNVVVSPHNAWTLTKHVAGSINKAASNIDAKVYGTKTNITVIEKPDPKPPTTGSDILSVIGILLLGVCAMVVFVLYITGHVKGRDIIGV
jgi:hypothetical protein